MSLADRFVQASNVPVKIVEASAFDSLVAEVRSMEEECLRLTSQLDVAIRRIEEKKVEISSIEGDRAALQKKVGELEERIRILSQNPPSPPSLESKFILVEKFDSIPKDVRDGGRYVVEANGDYGLGKDPDGNKYLVSQMRSNQPLDMNKRIRNEFSLREEGETKRIFRRDPWGSTRWYGIKIRLPSSWVYDKNKILLWQMHGSEDEVGSRPENPTGTDEGKGRNPPLCLQVWNKTLEFRHVWEDEPVSPGLNLDHLRDIWETQVELGKWYRFIVCVRWDWKQPSNGGKGFIRIWEGDKKVVDLDPYQQGYNDVLGPYDRIGGYWPAARDNWPNAYSPVVVHDIHYGGYVIGNEKCTLEDMKTALA